MLTTPGTPDVVGALIRTTLATTTAVLHLACRLQALGGLQTGNDFGLQGLSGVGFDALNLALVTELGQRHGQAIATRTAGSADAVHIVLGLHRQAVIEDVGDAGHVDASRRHIRGHQNLHLAIAQGHQTTVAQGLAQRTMQRHGRKAGLLQVLGQGIAFNLGAGKHNGLLDAGFAQPVVQQATLVVTVVGPEQGLTDVGVFFLRRVDLHVLRRAHDSGGQLLDARRKGGAEHHGLVAVHGQLVDLGQVFGKTQVKHAVRFVEHQELHLLQLDLSRALQVEQATRCSHHQIGVLQTGDLHGVRHAAHHVGNAQALGVTHQANGVMGHLLGEFSCGTQHQRTGHTGPEIARMGRVLALGAPRRRLPRGGSFSHSTGPFLGFDFHTRLTLLQQGVQERQQEGRRLAAAGLAGHHQVDMALGAMGLRQGHGNGLGLHRGGLGEAELGHRSHQLGGKTQSGKGMGCRCVSGGHHRTRGNVAGPFDGRLMEGRV